MGLAQHTTTWQQQAKIFFDKNYGWILILTGLLAFILVERGQFFDEMMIGWNKVCKDCDDSMGWSFIYYISFNFYDNFARCFYLRNWRDFLSYFFQIYSSKRRYNL